MRTVSSRNLMTQYFGSYDHKIRTDSKDAAEKLKMMQIRMIEGYAKDNKGNKEWLERAERTIAELEESLPYDWRYKHLTY